ncbi:MAG: hypothetical protein A2Z09_06240 [Nitrospirae bacterium RBG_16_43_8]|nr:MAG: hypothetical protein A2Z09_06240 [Nitrospirae bacterium RBG_16_43_8]
MYDIIDKTSKIEGTVRSPRIIQKTEGQAIALNTLSQINILREIDSSNFYSSQRLPMFFYIGFAPMEWTEAYPLYTPLALNSSVVVLTGMGSEWKFERQQDIEDIYDNLLNEEYTAININSDIQEKTEDYFETLVVVKYKYIPEVKAIYIDEHLDEKNVTIFLSVKQYDDKLMETLIQKEIDISKLFPNIFANYNYVPDLIDDKKSIVGDKTTLIFER